MCRKAKCTSPTTFSLCGVRQQNSDSFFFGPVQSCPTGQLCQQNSDPNGIQTIYCMPQAQTVDRDHDHDDDDFEPFDYYYVPPPPPQKWDHQPAIYSGGNNNNNWNHNNNNQNQWDQKPSSGHPSPLGNCDDGSGKWVFWFLFHWNTTSIWLIFTELETVTMYAMVLGDSSPVAMGAGRISDLVDLEPFAECLIKRWVAPILNLKKRKTLSLKIVPKNVRCFL
jgi:hypothetical protein